jgi:molecular chaperone DnaK (HSP70)
MANTEKVPSRIAYGPPPKREILWGNQIKPNTKAKIQVLMKLKLDERLKSSKQLKMLLKFLSIDGVNLDDSDDEDGPPDYPGKEPVDIVADYLTEIRKHTFLDLQKIYGSALQTLTKELVVTVPAVWSERAKDLTVQAVSKANFDVSKFSMVTEPEAAAIYTLKDMKEGSGNDQIQVIGLSDPQKVNIR